MCSWHPGLTTSCPQLISVQDSPLLSQAHFLFPGLTSCVLSLPPGILGSPPMSQTHLLASWAHLLVPTAHIGAGFISRVSGSLPVSRAHPLCPRLMSHVPSYSFLCCLSHHLCFLYSPIFLTNKCFIVLLCFHLKKIFACISEDLAGKRG